MPRRDGTGPLGLGSMTGRGAGYCAGNVIPGFANPRGGRRSRGKGGCWGFGRGIGFIDSAFNDLPKNNPLLDISVVPTNESATPVEGLAGLRELTAALTRSLEVMNKRLDALDAGKTGDRE